MRVIQFTFAISVAAISCASAQTISKHEMIAAANPLAAQAGMEILHAGGSAVDAAIAVQMVLNLVEPESSGIGGGAFMLLFDPKTHRATSFDGREVAPASARADMFLGPDGQPRARGDVIPGGLSVGVPGVLAMLEMAHKKYGKLPWAKLFAPAIRMAENGIPVGRKLAATIQSSPQMAAMPDIRRIFFHANGTPLRQGETLKNPELAASFRAIAKGGAKAFYTGDIAKAIMTAVRHAPVNPGGMTLADLAKFRPRERSPVCGVYRVWRVCSMGPPSSGGIAIVQLLGMLQRFPASRLQPGTLSEAHLFTQASRLAYADRAKYLGDTAFVSVPVAGLLDKHYLASRAALIDPTKDMGTAMPGEPRKHAEYAPQVSPVMHGTSHMSIVDKWGQSVAMTTSVEHAFGAEITAGGFILNNTLTDFSFEPVRGGLPVANAPAPGKRPLSAMSPTLVFDKQGRFLLSLGSPGGPAIIDYVAQTLVALLDGKLPPQAAIAQPRHLNLNGPTLLETAPGIDAVLPGLVQMGHRVGMAASEASGLQAIEKVPGGYIGGADPRRDGVAVGD